jgi:sugar/nucleoside kinase (ribokinase family)
MMIGHFAKDRLIVDGTGAMASGGAVYYGSVALRRVGVRVAVVTRLHPDDFLRLNELRREGVQVFATAAPETSGIENIYNSVDMERRICKPLGFAGPFRREEIPNLSAQVYLITPIIAGEIDLPLLKLLAARGPVGLDVQGFVRVCEDGHLVFRQWPDMAEGLTRPREIVVTQSSCVTVYADGQIHEAPFTPRSLS